MAVATAKTYTNTVSRAAAVRPSAFLHHHRRRCRCTSRCSCSGGIPTPMQSLRRRRQQRKQRDDANRAGPVWPGTVRPGPRTGPGPGSDRLGPVPAAAEAAYSQLDYTSTITGAAAATPSALRRRRHRRASCGSGSGGIMTPMPSPSSRLQRWQQQRVDANLAGPVRPGPRTGQGAGGVRFRSGGAKTARWAGAGWGRRQLQPCLPTHSLIYIHCSTPSSFGRSWQLFYPAISDSLLSLYCYCYCSHCYCRGIVIVVIVIVGALLL